MALMVTGFELPSGVAVSSTVTALDHTQGSAVVSTVQVFAPTREATVASTAKDFELLLRTKREPMWQSVNPPQRVR